MRKRPAQPLFVFCDWRGCCPRVTPLGSVWQVSASPCCLRLWHAPLCGWTRGARHPAARFRPLGCQVAHGSCGCFEEAPLFPSPCPRFCAQGSRLLASPKALLSVLIVGSHLQDRCCVRWHFFWGFDLFFSFWWGWPSLRDLWDPSSRAGTEPRLPKVRAQSPASAARRAAVCPQEWACGPACGPW